MNEAADVTTSLPTLVLLAFWWAFVSILSVLSSGAHPESPDMAKPAGAAKTDDKRAASPQSRNIREADPSFDERMFLEGAAKAYEIILNAFATADVAALRPLLAPDVLAAFEVAITERKGRQEASQLSFVRLKDACIESSSAAAEGIEVTVRLAAEIISATRSASNEVVDGDPDRIVATHDLWTFGRRRGDKDWRLVATDEA
ncbi:Tim44/TimA family putative adaptor protein [Arvimicrobium flavum]|uniref:Tim44/TimA family putative adaptor protein n=1 Tax=Arvimicrobium flavum TaxID=3393320 RepID=UPI00237BBE5D|nr:Tim44/TimA family putative adaptor protein [Mesorhizobium shangrilense]